MNENHAARIIAILTLASLGCTSMGRPPALMMERTTVAVRFTAASGEVRKVDLVGAVADITVEGTADSVISAELSLRSSDTERLHGECLESARVDTSRVRETLRIELRQESRKKCGETWLVRIPSRFAAEIKVSNGHVAVSGIHGGLVARATNTGKVSGSVRGDVDVEVGVGDVDLTSTQDYQDIELQAKVGKVRLFLRGYEAPADQRPGSGDHIKSKGPGSGSFKAVSRVGNVDVRIAAPG